MQWEEEKKNLTNTKAHLDLWAELTRLLWMNGGKYISFCEELIHRSACNEWGAETETKFYRNKTEAVISNKFRGLKFHFRKENQDGIQCGAKTKN